MGVPHKKKKIMVENFMVEIYSTARKAMKENQEHTSGDY